MMFSASIIVASDKGSRGEREDGSGPALRVMLEPHFRVVGIRVLPDDVEALSLAIIEEIDRNGTDLVVTSGGTGLGRRDVTPEATRRVIEKELPGFAEAMRMESYRITPHSIISRALCGTRGESIILNLPGSPRAATECLSFVLQAIPHALSKLKGDNADCGRPMG
jgi:molybdenum cofactor synthesis domain-containing protein